LSRSEIQILQAVSGPDGALASELAYDLIIDAGQLSRLLRGLTRRRLLVRIRSEPDGRKKRIVVTARGREALAALDRAALRLAVRVFGPLSEAEQERVADAAQTIGHALALPSRRLVRPGARS
jgi:DNA-binding MarR family transcriptional regulator